MGKIKKLTDQEGMILIKVARKAIEEKLFGKSSQAILEEDLNKEIFQEKRGVFVTLNKRGNLRGCIGHIQPILPLIQGVKENAINAAFNDPRFPPLSQREYPDIRIEVSVLTNPTPLNFNDPKDLLDKLVPNKHGVILKKGFYQSTFLPQVWKQLPDKKEFLTHLSMKAGLSPTEWMDPNIEVYTYEVQAFEEE
ncbi:TIGR00296 family protein [Desulfothermus okinawensis JCM 13304]